MSVNLGTATAYLDVDASKFNSELTEAEFKAKGFGDKTASAFSSMSTASAKLGSIGSTMTKKVTLPIAIAGAAVIKAGSDFQAGMSEVQAVGQMSGKDLEAVKQKAIEMGSQTKFSATEAANGFKYMA